MAKLSMNEMTTYRWSFEEDVHKYIAAGYDAIGVWRHKLSDYGEERGVELLSESGLAVSSVLWAGGFTGSEGRTHRESIDDAREAIRLTAALKASCLIVYSGARAGHTHNHARRLLRNALNELLPLAGDMNVTLAIEPMHAGCAAEWTFFTELDETLDFITAVDSPQLKLTFDTYHLVQDDGRLVGQLPELAQQIAIVQLGDARQPPDGEQNRCRLGTGIVPLQQTISALSAGGYDGFYDVELMGEDVESCDYQELLDQSKQVFEQLMQGSGGRSTT